MKISELSETDNIKEQEQQKGTPNDVKNKHNTKKNKIILLSNKLEH